MVLLDIEPEPHCRAQALGQTVSQSFRQPPTSQQHCDIRNWRADPPRQFRLVPAEFGQKLFAQDFTNTGADSHAFIHDFHSDDEIAASLRNVS